MQMPSSHARTTEVPQTAVAITIIQITPALLNPTLIQLACEWQRRSIITLGEGTVTNKYSSSTKAPFIFTLYDPPVSDTNSRYIVDLCRLFSFLSPFWTRILAVPERNRRGQNTVRDLSILYEAQAQPGLRQLHTVQNLRQCIAYQQRSFAMFHCDSGTLQVIPKPSCPYREVSSPPIRDLRRQLSKRRFVVTD